MIIDIIFKMSLQNRQNVVRLSDKLTALSGVGPAKAECFARLGIVTVRDLISHLPLRHEYEFAEGSIGDLPDEGIGAARGVVACLRYVPTMGRRKARLEITLDDGEKTLNAIWFNARYLQGKIHPGQQLHVQGKVTSKKNYRQMINPKWEVLQDEQKEKLNERLRPIYPATESLKSEWIAELVGRVLPLIESQLIDPLPRELLAHHAMPTLVDAFRMAHLPNNLDEIATARRRLAFNELLLLQLGIALKRHFNQTQSQAPALHHSLAIDEHIRQRFGFQLTASQDQVIEQMVADLKRNQPMNRLLQGDVGAGKTVVALYALLLAVADRKQAALMAPTELLAEQHYLSISNMLEGSNVRIALLTAGQAASGSVARKQMVSAIEQGEFDLVIGTQALVCEQVRFKDLAVVVVDEQHRFGVLQRAAFRSKADECDELATPITPNRTSDNNPNNIGNSNNKDNNKGTHNKVGDFKIAGQMLAKSRSPHYLVMTATPIPRTLSLTIFGDLDVSTIHGLPPGRHPIVTRVVEPQKSDEVYQYIAQRIADGEQAYIVVPAVEDNPDAQGPSLKNVMDHAEELQATFFKNNVVGTLHGRMKQAEREVVMRKFRQGEIAVLVATTVIEVGVDVPNATLMVVEHADRFGLAQLHQLRGRIGRGTRNVKNLCVFITKPTTEQAEQRMAAIASTTSGFTIAEKDLEIRGMGDFFGTRQHGLPPLRVARLPENMDLLRLAMRDAKDIIQQDPAMRSEQYQRLRRVLLHEYGDSIGLIDVG